MLMVISACRAGQASAWPGQYDFPFVNAVYDELLQTVQLYPNLPGEEAALLPPVVNLDQRTRLRLEFDDLASESADYQAMLLHCNFDWQPSALSPVEYLNEYNEFNIMDFEYSFNTKVHYVHYRFDLPQVKTTGNYLLVVYRNGDEDDVVITHRFVVFRDQAAVGARAEPALGSQAGAQLQQVQFNVNYARIPLEYPQQNVKVVLRKNYRWDNAITNLQPVFVKEFQKMLEYEFFNFENAFAGGNEYRFFNMTRFGGGLGVQSVERSPAMDRVQLSADKPRAGRAYNSQRIIRDLNGHYLIESREVREADTEADYTEVFFTLETEEPYPGEVYIFGGYNFFKLAEANKMELQEGTGRYTGSLLLKQGRYDYCYVTPGPGGEPDQVAIEGSFSLTENTYDVIVYYRSPGSRADQVIGYTSVGIQR